MPELVALGTAGGQSNPFTVAEGETKVVKLKSSAPPLIPPGVVGQVQYEAGGQYYNFGDKGTLSGSNPAVALDVPGTYRLKLGRSESAVGAHLD